jgi:hypothetical protein
MIIVMLSGGDLLFSQTKRHLGNFKLLLADSVVVKPVAFHAGVFLILDLTNVAEFLFTAPTALDLKKTTFKFTTVVGERLCQYGAVFRLRGLGP